MINNLRGPVNSARKRSGRSLGLMIEVVLPTVLVPFALTAALAQEGKPAKKPAAAPAANVATGRKLYASAGCATCHGDLGRGGSGPPIVPLSLKLPAFVTFIRKPSDSMRPLSEKDVSDAHLADVHAFLASVRASSDAGTSAAPLIGNAENGKMLNVRDGCYECHGMLGQGGYGYGPRLGPDPISLPAFMSYTRKPTGVMPAYSAKLASDQDVADIHAYLTSMPRPVDIRNIPLFK